MRSYNPGLPVRVARFGLVRVRSPLLAESWLFSFPPGTEMVHFPGFAPPAYVFGRRRRELTPARFPHSDIPGSQLAYSSPRLFAVSHVLHRLLSPRHPPYALSSLTLRLARNQLPPRSRGSGAATGSATRTAPGTPRRRAGHFRRLPMTFSIRLSMIGIPLARHPWRGSGAFAPRPRQRPAMVGVAGFEPATSSLSGMRSNQLSYTPPVRRRSRRSVVELIGVEPTTS